jgi:acetyl-CoA/propionyl-CoA carboxylase biotin carboxyl carrier protein
VVESEELAQRAHELSQSSLAHLATTVAAASDGRPARRRDRVLSLELDGRRHELRLHLEEPPWIELARRHRERSRGIAGEATSVVASPMQGTVLAVTVSNGDRVEAGSLLCVVEAMKMENEIVAHRDGVVDGLSIAPGDQVASGQRLCRLVPDGAGDG